FVDFATAIRTAIAGVTHTQAQVFGRAGLNHVFAVDIALPRFTVVARSRGEVFTLDIARQERQTRHTISRHIDVVTGLPGFFVGVVEVGILNGVADENGAVAVNAVLVVTSAVNLLTTDLEGVRADGVTGGETPDGVVQITAQFLADA